MPTDHFAEFFPTVCAGLGLVLVGGVNLLLSGQRLFIRIVATLAAIGVAVAAPILLEQPDAMVGTAWRLAVGLLPCLLFASGRLVGWLSAFVALLRRPAVRYALVAVVGIGVVLVAAARFDRADKAAQDAEMADLDTLMRSSTVETTRATATTDAGHRVSLKDPVGVREGIDWTRAEDRALKNNRLEGQVIRRGGASDQSNCHGWVFADGKFNVSNDDVEIILKENGYQQISEPHLGDLAVYRSGGTILHTAIVRYVTTGQPVLVEGKWGNLGVFLHAVDKSVYGTDYAFYRSQRNGHVLVGLGSSATPAQPSVE
jgi:hypothetical protein